MAREWSCTVAEAKARCSVAEFWQWAAYDAVEPFGDQREDLRVALAAYRIAETVWATAGSKKRFPMKLREFMVRLKSQNRRRQSPKEIEAKLMLFAEAHNRSRARK